MNKQKGMTLVGMLMTMVVVVLSAIVVIRVVPVYLQYYAVIQSIKSLNTTSVSSLSGDPVGDISVLRNSLSKRLDINGVSDLKENQLEIIPVADNRFKVKLKYQVIRPLVFNISLMFDFDNTQEVVAGSEN